LLLILLLIWPTWLCPPRHLPVALVVIATVVPLLFPLRGLLHGRRSSFTWAGYLSLFYFVHAVTEAGALEEFRESLAVGLELISSLILFFGTVFYLKATKLS
ncbi:MAG: DUF2069 domain-containing protein, partial [Methylococcales bacterium]